MNIPEKNAVIFFRGKGFISEAILACQSLYTEEHYNHKSKWSHVGFIGSDGRFYESTVEWGTRIVYGVRSISRRKLMKEIKEAEKIGVQSGFVFFPLLLDPPHRFGDLYNKTYIMRTNFQWMEMTNYAKELIKRRVKYGFFELFGTLWTILRWKFAGEEERKRILADNNPFDSNDVYCISFVSDCFKNGSPLGSIDYTPPAIATSNLTVDDGWFGCQLACKMEEFDGFCN